MRCVMLCSCLLTLLHSSCSRATPGVCASWPAGNTSTHSYRALDREVNAYAHSLDPQRPLRENARAIAAWLRQQPCIREVGVATDVVATEPPGLDLTVIHRNGSKRTFSVLFGPDQVKLSNSY